MAKNISISEGTQGKVFTGVTKIKTALQGGGTCNWIPEDEAGDYVKLKTKTIKENGEYIAEQDDAIGYKSVKVNVKPNLSKQTFEHNGTYEAEAYDVDGFSQVIVKVAGGSGTFKTKKITYNGVFRASDDGVDGYTSVRVNVEKTQPDAGVLTPLVRGTIADYIAGRIGE